MSSDDPVRILYAREQTRRVDGQPWSESVEFHAPAFVAVVSQRAFLSAIQRSGYNPARQIEWVDVELTTGDVLAVRKRSKWFGDDQPWEDHPDYQSLPEAWRP